MKIYIQTDIEGMRVLFLREPQGRLQRKLPSPPEDAQLLTDEVNAAVKASFDAGADEVLVNDSHGSGYNILFEDLDPRCRIIHGRELFRSGMAGRCWTLRSTRLCWSACMPWGEPPAPLRPTACGKSMTETFI